MKITRPGPDSRFGETLKFFHDETACTLQAVRAEKSGLASLNIQIAPVISGSANWNRFDPIQVSPEELPRFCACAIKLLPGMEARFHGEARNRSYSIQWRKEGLSLGQSEPGGKLYINLSPDDAFWVSDLALERLHLNLHSMTKTDLMNLLSRHFRAQS